MTLLGALFCVLAGTFAICTVLIATRYYIDAHYWRRFVRCMDSESSALVILHESERMKRDEMPRVTHQLHNTVQ